MNEWWNALSPYARTLFIIACSTSLLFVVQLILLLVGFSLDDMSLDTPDTDIDGINDGDFGDVFGLKLLTLRGISAFLCIGAWTAFVILEASNNIALSTCLGALAGLVAMVLIAFVMKQAMKLEEDGNINIDNTIGLTANVYLAIPKENKGTGKVNVLVQERLMEYDAMTKDTEDIKTGQTVRVLSSNNNILEVTANKERVE